MRPPRTVKGHVTQQEFMRIWIQSGHTPPVLAFTVVNPQPLRWGAYYDVRTLIPSPYRTFLYWLGTCEWPEHDAAYWN